MQGPYPALPVWPYAQPLDGNLVSGEYWNKYKRVGEENDVFDDGIVNLEIVEEPLDDVACDYSKGDADDADEDQKELVRGGTSLAALSSSEPLKSGQNS